VTALLVARPAVLGEDPGLSSDFSDTGSMVLTLCWLIAAAVAAVLGVWKRLPQGEGVGRPGTVALLVGLGLLGTTLTAFAGAEYAAPYRYPARLIAWEWFGLFAVFFTVRRVAASPRAQRGMLTALLATGVSMSAHAVYQEGVELPRVRREYSNPVKVQQDLAHQGLHVALDDPQILLFQKRALDNHVYGTYAHPNSFAGCLALLLPGLVGASMLCLRQRAGGWQTWLTVLVALLGCVALWLTHSRGALLGVAVAGLCVLVTAWRWLWAHRVLVLVAAALAAAGSYGLYKSGLAGRGLGKESSTLDLRLLYWRTTAQIIREHPWLGVGPGNFGGAYAAHIEWNAAEQIKDPHDFALEVWATCGLAGLLSLLVSLVAFFVAVGRGLQAAPTDDTGARLDDAGPRWEFYAAGVIGLLLGFVIRVAGTEGGSLLESMATACLRSFVWFAAFALLEGVVWPARARALALTAGVIALLVNLTVSGGIAFPSVATFLWAAAALALNAAAASRSEVPVRAVERALQIAAVPLMAGMAIVYLGLVFYPVTTSAALVQQARSDGELYRDQLEKGKGTIARQPISYLRRLILKLLDEASRLTPDDARVQALLAPWYGELWRLELLRDQEVAAPRPQAVKAVEAAVAAQRLDPDGIQGYMAEYQLRIFFAQEWEALAQRRANQDIAAQLRKDARVEYVRAAEALRRYLPHDPTDLTTRYLRARALFLAGDTGGAGRLAAETLRIDEGLTRPTRRLSQEQLKDLRHWAAGRPAG
jgi:hypothetical protein